MSEVEPPTGKQITMKLLNLGCGRRFHSGWVNLDIQPSVPEVKKWDLHAELPFPDAEFDVVYHSHVLEHFARVDGLRLLRECRRVLKSGGILRVVVPDLERIAELYLEALKGSLQGDKVWVARYDWLVLELYDQFVRETPGGEMLKYVRQQQIPDRDFVIERTGGEYRAMMETPEAIEETETAGRAQKHSRAWSRKIARVLLGREGITAHDVGVFRKSGEIHRTMYDRYSLDRALREVGFSNVTRVGPADSAIKGWSTFNLDTEVDGRVYKPDSLYMEAVRD